MTSPVVEETHAGMGAIPHASGVAFRVWAPHADAVYVIGSFNQWAPDANPMAKEEGGNWYADIPTAAIGNEYRFRLVNGGKELFRIDPHARQVTTSIGNAVIHDPHFDWEGDDFKIPAINEMVIYEMHLGTFPESKDDNLDKFAEVFKKVDHLQRLGVNMIEVMPIAKQSDGYFRFQCPGCGELRATVSPRNNLAHCFSCQANYNNIDLMMLQGHDFASAVQILRNWLEQYCRDLGRSNPRSQ